MASRLEALLNSELAAFLRERGLDAVAGDRNLADADVLIDLEDEAVAVAAGFPSAQDSSKRLPKTPLRWRGLPIETAFEVAYPAELQRMTEAAARRGLRKRSLEFQKARRGADGWSAEGAKHEGDAARFADGLLDHWLRQAGASAVDEAVQEASSAIEEAAQVLERAAGMAWPRPKEMRARR